MTTKKKSAKISPQYPIPIWTINICPHCHQEEQVKPADWRYGHDILERTNNPHANPFECIEFLRYIINDIKIDISYLKSKNDEF